MYHISYNLYVFSIINDTLSYGRTRAWGRKAKRRGRRYIYFLVRERYNL